MIQSALLTSQPETAPVLTVTDLKIRFGGATGIPVVDGISFSVMPGKTLCLVGESGCGKSVTALSVMDLLPQPPAHVSARAMSFRGNDLAAMPAQQRAALRGDQMTMIFQEPMTALNPSHRIGDQIAEVVLRHRKITSAEARAVALEMLKKVRVPAPEKRLDVFPHELSGGMRQRVMIAMALANNPALIIADEPTTALDVTIQAQILTLIRNLQQDTGTAMLLITHDLGVVAEIADDVAIMYAGHIVEFGSVADIFDDPQHPYTLGLMGSRPSLGKREGALAAIEGQVPQPANFPKGCRFSTRCPFADDHCARERPELVTIQGQHRAACFKLPLEALAGGLAA